CWKIVENDSRSDAERRLGLRPDRIGTNNQFGLVGTESQPTHMREEHHIARVLWLRHLGLLSGLVVRDGADPKQAERLVTWLTRKVVDEPTHRMWKARLQQMLIALDQPKELAKHLAEWIKQAEALDSPSLDHRWHVSLGYLLAE